MVPPGQLDHLIEDPIFSGRSPDQRDYARFRVSALRSRLGNSTDHV
jgi:hypothetical protein